MHSIYPATVGCKPFQRPAMLVIQGGDSDYQVIGTVKHKNLISKVASRSLTSPHELMFKKALFTSEGAFTRDGDYLITSSNAIIKGFYALKIWRRSSDNSNTGINLQLHKLPFIPSKNN